MSRSSLVRSAIPTVVALAFSFATNSPAAFAHSKKTTTTTTASTTTPATTVNTTKTTKTNASSAGGNLTAGQKFSTAAAAQASCPADTVVWASFTTTHSFHLANSKYYGKTKHGAFMCEKAAATAGYHQSKT